MSHRRKDDRKKDATRAGLRTQVTKGSPAAVLEAMRRLPDLKLGDVDALEQIIELGKRPVRAEGIFDRRRRRQR